MSSALKSIENNDNKLSTKSSVNSTSVNGTKNGTNNPNEIRILKPLGYVGFDSLPEQLVARIVRDGFAFNILTVGGTGVGKTTLIDSLFNMKFPDQSTRSHSLSNVDVVCRNYEMVEKNIKLKLGLIETRGFGDQINKSESYKPIVNYIDDQFEMFLQEELKVHRTQNVLSDSRVHVCLYLISPTGNGLKSIDLITMQNLDKKVNLIPIIAKSDTITKQELEKFKSKVMAEIVSNGINIYHFPTDDPEVADINTANNCLLPFAAVASHDFVRLGNKQVRARQYPWGTVQVENENHSDFFRLREMLLRINMEDLRDTTHTQHYENYRRRRLEQMGFGETNDIPRISFQENMEAKRERLHAEMKRREEEMRQSFVIRVKEKEAELKEQEKEIHLKFDRLKKSTNEEKRLIEIEKQKLEDEIAAFKTTKNSLLGINSLTSQSSSTLSSTFALVGKNKKK